MIELEEQIEYLEYKDQNNELIRTNVPLKKGGIYYLSGEEQYWLISSGKNKDLQNPFISKGVIGIGWDKITLDEIKNNNKEDLKELLFKKYRDLEKDYKKISDFKRYISSVATKLIRFVYEMQLGDIIVLKDRGSNKIYFGKIISEAEEYSEEDLPIDETTGKCNKIRKIRWLKSIEKDKLGSELKLALTARHALSLIDLDKVKNEINREIFSYFYCGENLHIVFNIELASNISQDFFKEFLDYIYNLKQKCIEENKSENNFNIKTNVQSPGPVEYFGNPEIAKYIYGVVTGLGIAGTCCIYNSIKEKLKIKNPQKNDEEIDKDRFSEGN